MAATLVALLIGVSACGAGEAPAVPLGPDGQPDLTLELGRQIYGKQCTVCHGSSGQGGRGKKLNDGAVFELHPEIETMIEVITNGKGQGMKAFDDILTEEEIEAVARYVREVLNEPR